MLADRGGLMYNFRGVYDQTLTHGVAYFAGLHAAGHYRKRSGREDPEILVGNDHRFSSASLKHYLIQGLLRGGARVRDVGCLPTSVVAYGANRAADGACVVTASHNPPEYNGLKFFESSGAVMKPAAEDVLTEQVIGSVRESPKPPMEDIVTERMEVVAPERLRERYINEVAEAVEIGAAVTVGLDCRLGTANLIVPQLLERLGCEYSALHTELHPYFLKPNGQYLNPEPKQDNIEDITALMNGTPLDIGLIFDGDSDRNVITDNKGQYLQDDLVLLALAMECGEPDRLRVMTVDSSLMVERELQRLGYRLAITPVGDPFVAAALEEKGGSFGGVPNGHYIFPDFNLYSDGIYTAVTMLRIVARLKERGETLRSWVETLPPTTILKRKHPFGRSREEFVGRPAPALRELFERRCGGCDYLETDDCVVTAKNEDSKLLVRYNRWDNNFNVQAESLASPEQAQEAMGEIIGILTEMEAADQVAP